MCYDKYENNERGKKMNSELRKRLLIFGGVGVGLVVVILLIVWIVNLNSGSKVSFEEAEETLKAAAIAYYKDNQQLLPSNGGEVSVEAAVLADDYMKPLKEIVPEGASCTGKVVVKQQADGYSYTPYLDCKEQYATKELYKKILEDHPVVTSSSGLYEINGEYVFRGEEVDNYVQIDDNIFQIVKINADNEIQLLLQNSKLKFAWDDRYNIDRNRNTGINNFLISRIRTYLEDLYDSDALFTDFLKERMSTIDLCYGKRDPNSSINDGSVECAQVLPSQHVGLITTHDFMLASLDSSCQTALDPQCQNYNYLAASSESNWWTLTASSSDTYRVYVVVSSGYLQDNQASGNLYVRPVIELSNTVMYKSGTGTSSDPYIIK